MKVLGIDGALGVFSAAVAAGEKRQSVEVPGNVALERGLGAIAELLARAGNPKLDRIGVGVGPGTFTGVRIAISYAKSLALGWQLPLCGISTFDLLETGIERSGEPLLTAVRGRAGVLSVRFRTESAERRASGYTADVLVLLEPYLPQSFRLTGNGAEDVLAALGERAKNVKILAPAVESPALAAAMLAAQSQPASSVHEVRADYGEQPAARLPKK